MSGWFMSVKVHFTDKEDPSARENTVHAPHVTHEGRGGGEEAHQGSTLIIFIHEYPLKHNPSLLLLACFLGGVALSLISSPPRFSPEPLQRHNQAHVSQRGLHLAQDLAQPSLKRRNKRLFDAFILIKGENLEKLPVSKLV